MITSTTSQKIKIFCANFKNKIFRLIALTNCRSYNLSESWLTIYPTIPKQMETSCFSSREILSWMTSIIAVKMLSNAFCTDYKYKQTYEHKRTSQHCRKPILKFNIRIQQYNNKSLLKCVATMSLFLQSLHITRPTSYYGSHIKQWLVMLPDTHLIAKLHITIQLLQTIKEGILNTVHFSSLLLKLNSTNISINISTPCSCL